MCLFPHGELRGMLEVLVNVRVSDFLRQQSSFVVLRRCIYAPYNEPNDSPRARQLLTALVNWRMRSVWPNATSRLIEHRHPDSPLPPLAL